LSGLAEKSSVILLEIHFCANPETLFLQAIAHAKPKKKLRIAEKFFADIIISTTATGCGRKDKGHKNPVTRE
jgi:hypothetical protein